MKNYKIIENRPELSPEQIKQGMNFEAVKSGLSGAKATAIKTGITKSIIVKVLVVAGVLTSSVFVYQNLKLSSTDKAETSLTESMGKVTYDVHQNETVRMATTKHLQMTVVSSTKAPSSTNPLSSTKVNTNQTFTNNEVSTAKSEKPIVIGNKPNKKDTVTQSESINPVYKLTEPFRESPNAKCVLLSASALEGWSTAISPITMNCNHCQFEYVTMSELEEHPNLKMLWLTVTVSGKSKFNLDSHLKNISLLRVANGKSVHPVAISIGAPSGNSTEGRFISDKFKTTDLKVIFTKQVDIFIFFDNPKAGDRLVFDDFVLAEVKE